MEYENSQHELAVYGARDGANEETAEARESIALAPVDGGRRAWLCLGACFSVEALAWAEGLIIAPEHSRIAVMFSGSARVVFRTSADYFACFPLTFGIFEDYYTAHSLFSSQASSVSAIGTSALGIMYFAAPLLSWGLQRWPHLRRTSCVVGLAILTVASVGASFAQTVDQLIATQGVLYAIGGGLLYFPAVPLLDEYFIRRRGLAYGVMWAGSGAAGVVLPYVLDWLLSSYGFRTALRVWAIVMLCLTTPALFFLRPRIPLAPRRTVRVRENDVANPAIPQRLRHPLTDLGFLATSSFWFLQVGNILINLGYFLPTIYVPSYARAQSFGSDPRAIGTTAISLNNLATVLGAVATGLLIDRFQVTSIILISSLGSAAVVFLLWGFAISPAMLYVFAISYGLIGGGFSVTWSGCAGAIRTQMETRGGQGAGANVQTSMVIASFAAGKGIGAVVSGPLSSKLLGLGPGLSGNAIGAYGTSYEALVAFTGITACLGGLGWLGRRVGAV